MGTPCGGTRVKFCAVTINDFLSLVFARSRSYRRVAMDKHRGVAAKIRHRDSANFFFSIVSQHIRAP